MSNHICVYLSGDRLLYALYKRKKNENFIKIQGKKFSNKNITRK